MGGAGNDLLLGGRGNDVINGGGGRNILAGGRGRDALVRGARLDNPSTSAKLDDLYDKTPDLLNRWSSLRIPQEDVRNMIFGEEEYGES